MLNTLITSAERIFIACGLTDFRKQSNSLVQIVHGSFNLDPYNESYGIKIAELKAANENLLRILRHGNKVKFGRSSEVTPKDAKQLYILENDEELSNQLDKEEEKITIKQYSRKKKKPGIRQEILRNLQREVVEFEIYSKEACPNCDGKLTSIGKEYVRTVVKYIPATC